MLESALCFISACQVPLVTQAYCMAHRRLATFLQLLPGGTKLGPCADTLRIVNCCFEHHSALWPALHRHSFASGQATLVCPLLGLLRDKKASNIFYYIACISLAC